MSDLPKDTKEFATWLRSIADQIDRIPVAPVKLREEDVEIGFYYGGHRFPDGRPMFTGTPTGFFFQALAVTTNDTLPDQPNEGSD